MAPKNKGKKGKKLDDEEYWSVMLICGVLVSYV
jgi:hypothetical protein